ncbi:hypothetical protein TNCV_2492961 [Trichonephila clavipes]|uniref:Uncharacterized protein n=1 Tax=Trichonephila clavipes TaxID=2585209 RepID=A0A8X6RRS7_TRICX|nr:hypothetical protein TNCV_2492961 [Trichonephila clavipes]
MKDHNGLPPEEAISSSTRPKSVGGSFAMREKGGNHLVPGPDYMTDALKLPNQAPRGSGESIQTCVAWRCHDGAQHLFCWPFLVNR